MLCEDVNVSWYLALYLLTRTGFICTWVFYAVADSKCWVIRRTRALLDLKAGMGDDLNLINKLPEGVGRQLPLSASCSLMLVFFFPSWKS